MDNNDLIKPFEETLYSAELQDITIDFSEMALDDLTKLFFEGTSDALLSFPIVKGIVALGKTVWNIQRAVSTRNQLTFIQSIKNERPNPIEIEKRKKALKNNEKWIQDEIELTVVYLDRHTSVKKAKYQAKMYADLINGAITFNEYQEYLAILDQLIISDINHFLETVLFVIQNQESFYNSALVDQMAEHFDRTRCRRLESLGLLNGYITTRTGTSIIDRYAPTEQGIYLYNILRENDSRYPSIQISDKKN